MPETQSITGAYKIEVRDLRGNNIPIDRRAQALRPYSNGFCPQCRGELRSPKRIDETMLVFASACDWVKLLVSFRDF